MASKRDVLKVLTRHYDEAKNKLKRESSRSWSQGSEHPVYKRVRDEYQAGMKKLDENHKIKVDQLLDRMLKKYNLTLDPEASRSYIRHDLAQILQIDGVTFINLQITQYEEKRRRIDDALDTIRNAFNTAEEVLLLQGASTDGLALFKTFTDILQETLASIEDKLSKTGK